jgi:predicted acyl esterase
MAADPSQGGWGNVFEGDGAETMAHTDHFSLAVDEKIVEETRLAMRDGVHIALRIVRPKGAGPFPTLFAASPYQLEFDDLPAYSVFPWRETGPIDWYVAQGYAYVHADVRGAGKSEGRFGFLDAAEQADYVELLGWVARQPWCNGRIGGIGQSYYAMAQWLMATLKPPGLACIAPYDGLVDQYRCSNYHGGIFCSYRSTWYTRLLFDNQHRMAGAKHRERMPLDLVGEILANPLDGAWWRERSAHDRLDRIAVPVLSIGHWGKMGLHLRGNILGYEGVIAPKRLVVTGARNAGEAHHLFDRIDFHASHLLPFYDHYLKGLDNGYDRLAPVKLYVINGGGYRDEAAWPVPRAVMTPLYLGPAPSGSVTSINDGSLSFAPAEDEVAATSYTYPDPGWSNGVVARGPDGKPDPVGRVLTFTTAPLAEDLEIAGPIVLKLYASSDQPDCRFIVKLSEQDPQWAAERAQGVQPNFRTVAKGWLLASHREKDEARSTALRPFYTHANPQPLMPGEVYQLDIEILPVACRFRKGHRIRLEIANGDSGLTDYVFAHPYHPSLVGTDTVHHDRLRPSALFLPVV